MGSLLLGSIGNTQIGVSVHAQAIIVAALNEQWDRHDGGQQRSIVNALDASTAATEEAEKWARDRLRPAE